MKLMQDDNGNWSSMRFVMIVAVFIAANLTFMAMKRPEGPLYNDIYIIGVWLLFGVGGKNVGKFLEKMNAPNPPTA